MELGPMEIKKNAETSIAFLKRSKYLGKESGFLKRCGSKSTSPAVLYFSFRFYNNNSSTINRSER